MNAFYAETEKRDTETANARGEIKSFLLIEFGFAQAYVGIVLLIVEGFYHRMIAIKKAEASFNHSITIDLMRDKKLYLGINILSVLLLVLFYFAFYYATLSIVPAAGKSIFYYLIQYLHLSGIYSLLFLPMLAFMMVFHELIHGIFLYLFTKSKPIFGFRHFMAYAGAPDWYIRKDCYIIVALAPFIIITLLCYMLLLVVPNNILPLIFLTAVIHASGCIGDIYYTIMLLNKPKETYITDSGVSSIISYN